jgi:hypothetical protein
MRPDFAPCPGFAIFWLTWDHGGHEWGNFIPTDHLNVQPRDMNPSTGSGQAVGHLASDRVGVRLVA